MKNTVFLFFVISVTACESLKYPVTGDVTQTSECKSGALYIAANSQVIRAPIPDSLSCVFYTYDQEIETLTLQQINAGFNCCPGKIDCKISQQNDTIVVKTTESSSMCDCNCLYDVIYTLKNVTAGKYIIRFIEPYAGNQKPLLFSVDLRNVRSGEFCVLRLQYPWNISD